MNMRTKRRLASFGGTGLACILVHSLFLLSASADITDFSLWHKAEDPPNANFSASATSTLATLLADGGPIPDGTDIGYGTINGTTALDSTAGFVFSPAANFRVAIDFDLSLASAAGGLGLGFGIGEDASGANSAGVGLLTNDGNPFGNFFGAGRIGDVTQTPEDIGLAASLAGSLFVEYDSASGDVTVGANPLTGASSPSATATLAGIQNSWNDLDLTVAFFIRSQSIPFFAPDGWEGGQATALFSNFRVLEGSYRTINAIPEPGTWGCLAVLAIGGSMIRRRRAGIA